jgi:3-oxoacyl-[acyl-carrier protein] reductase
MTLPVALVTGASRGIGRATSERLAQQGFHVVGLARTANDPKFPGTLIACDLSDSAATGKTLDEISGKFAVGAIVNNYGVSGKQSLGEIESAEMSRIFDQNVRVAMEVTQHFLASMKERRYGRIVNVASRTIGGGAHRSSYSAAKSALVGCTKSWALEIAEYGITVNAVAPGPVETEMFRRSRPKGGEDELRLVASIPMKRLGQPAEIAAAIGFLLSPEAGFITGQVLGIDGGGSISGR